VAARGGREVEKRDEKWPHLSDPRDSGSIEQGADMVTIACRERHPSRSKQRGIEGQAACELSI